MKGLHRNESIWFVSCILLWIWVLAGCCGPSYQPGKAFPAPIPDNAKITFNYNSKGEYFIADIDGRAVLASPVPFAALVNRADKNDPEWMQVLGSYTLYGIQEHGQVWLCNKDLQCVEGRMASEAGGAVFSVNYDGRKLFIADAQGREVTEKELKPFAALIQHTDRMSKFWIKTLDDFTIYRINGSIYIVKCTPNHICYATCYDPISKKTCGLVNGKCPVRCP